jgi:hypothetical protein
LDSFICHCVLILASCYLSRGLCPKYCCRSGVSRPCSEWERVVPPRHRRQKLVGNAQSFLSRKSYPTFSASEPYQIVKVPYLPGEAITGSSLCGLVRDVKVLRGLYAGYLPREAISRPATSCRLHKCPERHLLGLTLATTKRRLQDDSFPFGSVVSLI